MKNITELSTQKKLIVNDIHNLAERYMKETDGYVDYLTFVQNMLVEYSPDEYCNEALLKAKFKKVAERLEYHMDKADNYVVKRAVNYCEEPIKAVQKLADACYCMLHTLDNEEFAEAVDVVENYPFDRSFGEELHNIINWLEPLTEEYQKSPTVKKLEALLNTVSDESERDSISKCIALIEAGETNA